MLNTNIDTNSVPVQNFKSPHDNGTVPSELIPVSSGSIGTSRCLVVDGRSLHGVLGVRRVFAAWIQARIEKYGFVAGNDFEVFSNSGKNSEGGRPSQEYSLSLNMAKELCMVENNEKGQIARRYFIECERCLLSQQPSIPDFNDPAQAARAWADAYEAKQLAETQRDALEAQAALDRPKVVFADSIEVAKTSILVGELAKLIKQSTGYDIGQNRMFDFLRDNGYLHKGGSQKNMPTQRSMDAGWMEIKEGTRIGSSGESHITKTTKITGRGQIYFVNLFKKMMETEGGAA